ncbi:unnamed protein product [Rotaria sp. Silwood1]|nr:unnamed protein product [Rotaria sp. Silwood1]
MTSNDLLSVDFAQIVPLWFNREKTLEKIAQYISDAVNQGCSLVGFDEAVVPCYPFWLEFTDGAVLNSSIQKEIHAEYMCHAVSIERGDLNEICSLAKARSIAVYFGCIERSIDRGGHSLYCSMVLLTVMSIGDGNELRVPSLVRSALYAQDEDLHVCIFPGSHCNTYDITLFIAEESRSFDVTASDLMRKQDFPIDLIHRDKILEHAPDIFANGGSCVTNPDGT